MLPTPAAVAGEAAGRAAAPVQRTCLAVPTGVALGFVGDFADPVPGGGVQDVLEGGDFGLREDGEKVVGYVEGVGAVEEAEGALEGRRIADVGEGGGVVDEAEGARGKEGGGVVRCKVQEGRADRRVRWTGHAGIGPGRLVGEAVESCDFIFFDAPAIVHVGWTLGERVLRMSICVGVRYDFVLSSLDMMRQIVMLEYNPRLIVHVECKIHVW